ncbi:MAG TPA: hypothetical protein VN962_02115 [Polyangia bacterium]|nr:hypothetical protein [Polyangia bacterium]
MKIVVLVPQALLILMTGCSFQLVSPPARMVNVESARSAAPGETVVGAKGAAHSAVFDAGAAIGTAEVRHGVVPGVEVDAEATYVRVIDRDYPDIDRNIYAARGGFKMSNAGGWAALLAGVGGGVSPAAGGFLAADVGGSISYPNCYAVPFLGGTLFASQPVAAKRVEFRGGDGSVVGYDTANTTLGFGVSTGVEIPLDRARCRTGMTPARIQIGLGMDVLRPVDGEPRLIPATGDTSMQLTTQAKTMATMGLAAGVEFPF